MLQYALRTSLVNLAAAGLATILLFGTVGVLAVQGPEPAWTRPVLPAPARVISRAVALPTPIPTPTAPVKLSQPLLLHPVPLPVVPTPFQREQRMSFGQLMQRWEPFIKKAAKRFNVPAAWIREVMRIESGGRTMTAENVRIVSSEGALGLMQIQPGTYAEMRQQYGLGNDPFDPHDNIYAGAAYLRWLRGKYGFPTMFEAYDDGPGHLEQRLTRGALLPNETRNYVKVVSLALGFKLPATQAPASVPGSGASGMVGANTASGPRPVYLGAVCAFTRPDGSSIFLDCTQVHAIRAPLIDEYAPEVKSVLTVGNVSQGVQETEESARAVVLSHGGKV